MIAHIDADSFFASVLMRKDPRLRGKPLLALGMGGGCVIAASYEAKDKGVKTGMPLKEALMLVPNAIRMPADFRETAIASHEIEAIIGDEGPLLEQMSVDEWFLDLQSLRGGIPQDPLRWGKNLQAKILSKTALSVSIGIGPSKLLAKMAGEYRKPAGVTWVSHHEAAKFPKISWDRNIPVLRNFREFGPLSLELFLKDRPAAAIPGIGQRRGVHAQAQQWKTAWDIATADTEKISMLFGKPGREMQQELLGQCLSPVTTDEEPPKSISRVRSFKPTNDRAFVWGNVLRHLEYVILKMRRQDLACKGVGVWLRTGSDYHHTGGNKRLPQAIGLENQLLPYVESLFDAAYEKKTRYSQAGLGIFHLCPRSNPQYSLFERPQQRDREEQIQHTLDDLHTRYGRNAITRGAALGVSSQTMPQLDFSVIND